MAPHAALAFALAPAPNALFGGLAGADSFSDYHTYVDRFLRSAYVDMGHFLTGVLLTTAVALPCMLAHTGLIAPTAAVMALGGGALVYGTSTLAD